RKDYEHVDNELVGDEVFYRLKMVDLDGAFEYSPTVYLALSDEIALIYPNPATDFVKIPLAERIPVQLRIFDQSGRLMTNKKIANMKLDVSNLSAGVYYYQLSAGGTLERGKLIIR
ncbi:MAG: T9SS type A sorting domain-containing protein, partial [Bacteroidota bacterium]